MQNSNSLVGRRHFAPKSFRHFRYGLDSDTSLINFGLQPWHFLLGGCVNMEKYVLNVVNPDMWRHVAPNIFDQCPNSPESDVMGPVKPVDFWTEQPSMQQLRSTHSRADGIAIFCRWSHWWGDEWWPMVETLPCGPKARRNKTCFEQMLDLFFLFFFDFGDGDWPTRFYGFLNMKRRPFRNLYSVVWWRVD